MNTDHLSLAAELADTLAQAEADLAAATSQRDTAVRAMLAEGVSAPAIAEVFGLTRSRVYQIRDGRR